MIRAFGCNRRKILRRLGIGLAAISAGRAEPVSAKEAGERLEAEVPALLRATGVPGLAVSMVFEGEVAWTKGFGVRNAENPSPVDPETVFEAASLSKPAFAYAALKLADRGELELDSPLSKYLDRPWVANEPRLTRITARMVLSHTSGLPHGRPPGTPIQLRFDPGARFAYSANGFEYLRAVVEKLSGLRLNAYMEKHLLRPLGMARSSFGWQERFRSNFASGHSRSGRAGLSGNGEFLEATKEERSQRERDYPEYRYPSASAGLYTTASDYARFVAAMMSEGSEALLSPHMTAEMLKTQTRITEPIGWSLGWGLERTTAGESFWHWGDWGVFRNFVIGDRSSKSGVVVLTNSFHGPAAYRKVVSAVAGGDHPSFSWVERLRP